MAAREAAFSPDTYGGGFHFRPDEIVRCFISKRRREVELSPQVRRRAGSVGSIASIASFGQISADRMDLKGSSPKENRLARADIAAAYGFHPGSHQLRRKFSDAGLFPDNNDQAPDGPADREARSQTLPGRLSPAPADEAFAELVEESRKTHQRKSSGVGSFLKDTLKRKRGKQEKQAGKSNGAEGHNVEEPPSPDGASGGLASLTMPQAQTAEAKSVHSQACGGQKSPRSPSTPTPQGDEKSGSSFLGRISSLLGRSTSREGLGSEGHDTLKKKRKPKKKKRKKHKGSDEDDEDGVAAASDGVRTNHRESVKKSTDIDLSTDDALDGSSGDEVVADSTNIDVIADSDVLVDHQNTQRPTAGSQQQRQASKNWHRVVPMMSVSDETAVDVCADSSKAAAAAAASAGNENNSIPNKEVSFEEALSEAVSTLDEFAGKLQSQYGDRIDSVVMSLIANPNSMTAYQSFSESAMELLSMISESTNVENAGLSERYSMALLLHFTATLVSSLPSHLKDMAVTIESHGIRLINNYFDFFAKGPGIAWSFIRRSFRRQQHNLTTTIPRVDMSLVSSPRQQGALDEDSIANEEPSKMTHH